MLSYESSLFLAVVGSLIFAGCAWLFSYGNTVDMFDELRRMDKRQVKSGCPVLYILYTLLMIILIMYDVCSIYCTGHPGLNDTIYGVIFSHCFSDVNSCAIFLSI